MKWKKGRRQWGRERGKTDQLPLKRGREEETLDGLDYEIEYLEKKLGIKKKKANDNDQEVQQNRRKLIKKLEIDGFGSDFLDLIEGNLYQDQEYPDIDPEYYEPAPQIDFEDIQYVENPSEEEWQQEDDQEEEDQEEESIQDEQTIQKPQAAPQIQSHDLEVQVRATLNRLAETNIEPLTTKMIQLYQSNSHNILNEILWGKLNLGLQDPNIPEHIIAVYGAHLSALGRYIGREVLAFIVDKMYPLINQKPFLKLWCYLFIFDGISSSLIIGLIKTLAGNLDEDIIEQLLLIFNLAGFDIRKKDPLGFKATHEELQSALQKMPTKNKRTEFMQEKLMNIRNNKTSLDQKQDRLAFLKQWIKTTVKKKTGIKEPCLNVAWESLGTSH